MRGAAVLVIFTATLLAGCFGAGMDRTPCKPVGAATHGTLRVEVHYGDGPYHEPGITPVGRCVSLSQDGKVLATARIGADGNATLNLPVTGQVYIDWAHPFPHDDYCAATGWASITVPGPTNVTLEVGNVCA